MHKLKLQHTENGVTTDLSLETADARLIEIALEWTKRPASAPSHLSAPTQPKTPVTPKGFKVTDNEPTVARLTEQEPTGQRARTLPLLGSANTTVSVAERLGDKLPMGVRVLENGKRLYRCAYKCPKCGNNGYRQVGVENFYAKCHQCETRLALEPKSEDKYFDEHEKCEIPSPIDGVFYVADKEHFEPETIDIDTYHTATQDVRFTVNREWLRSKLSMPLAVFMSTYTFDDSEKIYVLAQEEGEVLNEIYMDAEV